MASSRLVCLGLIGWLGFGLTSVAFAQVKPIKWADAVQLTRDHNPEIKAAEASVRQAYSRAGASRSGLFPEVTGSISAGRTSTTGIGDLTQTNYEAGINATQNLFTGFGDLARMKQTRALTEAAEAELRTIKAKVSSELKGNFQYVVYSKANVELSRQIVTRREYNLQMVQLRFESGRENKGSVLLSKAYLEEARLGLLQAENGLRVAQAQLKKSMGLEADAQLEVLGEVPFNEPSRSIIDFKSLVTLTPNHQQAIAQEAAAEQEIGVARSRFFPSLNLSGGTKRTDSEFFPNRGQEWAIGLSLSIPIFAGGRDYYASRVAADAYISSSRARENLDRTLLASLQQSHAAYVEAHSRYRTNLAFKEALEVRAKVARAKYNQGLLTFDDWDVIENDLIDRERRFLSSGLERVTSEAAWEQTQGKGVIP